MVLEITYDDYLEHYGVKGMRWGVRRDVGPDGTIGSGDGSKTIDKDKQAKRDKKSAKFRAKAEKNSATISSLEKSRDSLPKGFLGAYPRRIYNNDIATLEKTRERNLKDAERAANGELTSTQRKLVAGAAVGAVVAGTIGGAMYYNHIKSTGQLNSLMMRGQQIAEGRDSIFTKNETFSKKYTSAEELFKNVASDVNPNYNTFGGQMNCRRSTYTYELRRRGYDVEATTSMFGHGQSETGVLNAFTPGERNINSGRSMSTAWVKNRNVRNTDPRDNRLNVAETANIIGRKSRHGYRAPIKREKLSSVIGNQPNGARGEVTFGMDGFAHSLAYERVGGKTYMFDTQKAKMYNLDNPSDYKNFTDKWGEPSKAYVTRLDNVDLDEKFLSRWATNRSR